MVSFRVEKLAVPGAIGGPPGVPVAAPVSVPPTVPGVPAAISGIPAAASGVPAAAPGTSPLAVAPGAPLVCAFQFIFPQCANIIQFVSIPVKFHLIFGK